MYSLTTPTEDQDAKPKFKLPGLLMAHAHELTCMYDVLHAGGRLQHSQAQLPLRHCTCGVQCHGKRHLRCGRQALTGSPSVVMSCSTATSLSSSNPTIFAGCSAPPVSVTCAINIDAMILECRQQEKSVMSVSTIPSKLKKRQLIHQMLALAWSGSQTWLAA